MFCCFLVCGFFFFEFDSVKEHDESWAKAAHSHLNPHSWPSVCFLQDKDFADIGKLCWLCEKLMDCSWSQCRFHVTPALGPSKMSSYLLSASPYRHQQQIDPYEFSLATLTAWMHYSFSDLHLPAAKGFYGVHGVGGQPVTFLVSFEALWISGLVFHIFLPLSWQAFPRIAAECK